MLEIPESKTMGIQADKILINKRIAEVIKASSPHKFAFYHGDPAEYIEILKGKQIISAKGHGMFVDICCDSNVSITIGDGTNMRYHPSFDQRPEKHQLLIVFNDGSCVAFTVAMYGGIWAYRGDFENPYHRRSLGSISPLENAFNETYFDTILRGVTKDISFKALLATEQRIPGLGNGVLQDILFNAGIHPKRKKSTLSDHEKAKLFISLKTDFKKNDRPGRKGYGEGFFWKHGGI